MAEHGAGEMVGGYASGTLTEDEQRVLFEAALRDQEVFDALAEDEALKELLDDPVTRRRLLDATAPVPAGPTRGWLSSAAAWLRRPAHLALAGSLATALLASVVVLELSRQASLTPRDGVPSRGQREEDRPATEAARARSEQHAELEGARRSAEPSPAKAAPPRPDAWRVTPSVPEGSSPGPARSLFQMGPAEDPSGRGAGTLKKRRTAPAAPPGPARDRVLLETEEAAGTMAPLGLRYRLVDRRTGAATRLEEGTSTGAADDTELRLEVNQAGYLYVLERHRDGGGALLFPERRSGASEGPRRDAWARVDAGRTYRVALGRLAALGDVGSYRVVLLFSRRALIEPSSGPSPRLGTSLLDEARRLSQTQPVVFEQVPGEDGGTYLVDPRTTPAAALTATIIFDRR